MSHASPTKTASGSFLAGLVDRTGWYKCGTEEGANCPTEGVWEVAEDDEEEADEEEEEEAEEEEGDDEEEELEDDGEGDADEEDVLGGIAFRRM